MTGHEKECALATLALLIERAEAARDKQSAKDLRKEYQEVAKTETTGLYE